MVEGSENDYYYVLCFFFVIIMYNVHCHLPQVIFPNTHTHTHTPHAYTHTHTYTNTHNNNNIGYHYKKQQYIIILISTARYHKSELQTSIRTHTTTIIYVIITKKNNT